MNNAQIFGNGVINDEVASILQSFLFYLLSDIEDFSIFFFDSNAKLLWSSSLECASPLCKYICNFPTLWRLCEEDHADIASICNFERNASPRLSICHMGLFNISYAISLNNIFYGSIIIGQKIIRSRDLFQLSANRFIQRIKELKYYKLLDMGMKVELYKCYKKTAKIYEYPPSLLRKLSNLERILDEIIMLLRRRTEKLTLLRHEIHSPNINVRGNLNIALNSANKLKTMVHDQDDILNMLDKIIENINHGIRHSKLFSMIIENIVSSISNENFSLNITRCNIINMIYSAMDIFKSPAEKKDIVFAQIKKSRLDVEYVYGDHGLLMRLFINIYHNAVKYSYYGQDDLSPRSIKTTCENGEKFFIIRISNFGVGIHPKEIDLVWEAGYRGFLTRDRHRTGSGTGLSQIKKIVEAHYGKVYIKSDPLTNDLINGPYLTEVTVYLPYYIDKG